MRIKAVVFSGVALVTVIFIVILLMWYYSSTQVFLRKFGFEYPRSAKVIDYSYNFIVEDETFFLELEFDADDLGDLDNKLKGYFGTIWTEGSTFTPEDEFRAISNIYTKWELNDNDILSYYTNLREGRWYKSVSVMAFIVKSKDNHYYIYVWH